MIQTMTGFKIRPIAQSILLCGALVCFSQSSGAQTVFDDGGIHDLTSPLGAVTISNGTTVNFLAGSSVTGTTASFGSNGIRSDGLSTTTINGGTIIGGLTTNPSGSGPNGIFSNGGTINLFSGSVTGGTKAPGSGFGGNAITAVDINLSMTGGTITGGFKDTGSGFGGHAFSIFGGTVNISGGAAVGGRTTSITGDVLSLTNVTGSITGGSFTSGSGASELLSGNNITLDISGGIFTAGGRWNLRNASIINVFGTGLTRTGTTSGMVSGFLQDGSTLNVAYTLSGGSVININPVPANQAIQRFCDGVCLPAP